MSARLPLAVLAVMAIGAVARAQPSPQPGPPAQVLEKNLFGEKEPGDDEDSDGQAEATPEAPPAQVQAAPSPSAYDARVRQSFAAAESFQGRLDGGWIVSWRGGDLLDLQLVDKGKGSIEGAWRDLRAGAALNASGLVDPTPVTGGSVDAGFGPEGRGARTYRLTAHPTADGRLTGKLRIQDEVFDVTLRRAP